MLLKNSDFKKSLRFPLLIRAFASQKYLHTGILKNQLIQVSQRVNRVL